MAFRDDDEALRSRVDSLEDELARARQDAERLRAERDAALRPQAPSAHVWAPGASVWIEWRGTWWRGTIVHPVGHDLHRVHYTGWSTSWDENVGSARLAPGNGPAPGRVGGGGASLGVVILAVVVLVVCALVAVGVSRGPEHTGPPETSHPIADVSRLHAGEPIWVEWNGAWYLASVVTVSPATQTARIHYQDYGTELDEDVSPARIRSVE